MQRTKHTARGERAAVQNPADSDGRSRRRPPDTRGFATARVLHSNQGHSLQAGRTGWPRRGGRTCRGRRTTPPAQAKPRHAHGGLALTRALTPQRHSRAHGLQHCNGASLQPSLRPGWCECFDLQRRGQRRIRVAMCWRRRGMPASRIEGSRMRGCESGKTQRVRRFRRKGCCRAHRTATPGTPVYGHQCICAADLLRIHFIAD